jgi:hypothetical protein
MRVVQMKLIDSAMSKYGLSKVITWLCACHTSIHPQAVQQNRCIGENGNSVTQLNGNIPGAECTHTVLQWTAGASFEGS